MKNRHFRQKKKSTSGRIIKVGAITAALCLLIAAVNTPPDVKPVNSDDKAYIWPIEKKKSFDNLNKADKQKIRKTVKIGKVNGKKAAQAINRFRGKQKKFEIALRKVMDTYYSAKKTNSKAIKDFYSNIDYSGKKIVDHYKEAAAERANADNLNYETGKILVSFQYETPMEDIQVIMENEAAGYEVIDDGKMEIPEELPGYKKERLEKIRDFTKNIILLAHIRPEDTVERAEQRFKAYDCVLSAEENIYFEADGTVSAFSNSARTNDPFFNNTMQWNLAKINVPKAWGIIGNQIEREIWIAVIDCGVQMDHPDLKGNLLTNYSVDVTQDNKKLTDCADVKPVPEAEPYKGQYTQAHGTMVSGVIIARANNGKMIAGAATYGSAQVRNLNKVMAIKADDSVRSSRHITLGYLSKGIDYAVEHGAEVINISYSISESDFQNVKSSIVRDSLVQSINRAVAANVTVVCAAGNDGTAKPRYPAALPGTIGVGATEIHSLLTTYTNESDAVDIVAPGGEIYCPNPNCYKTDCEKKICSTTPTTMDIDGYGYGKGTSYATPHVAAAVAMMYSVNYKLTPETILAKLKSSSTVSVPSWLVPEKSFPLLNAGRAVSSVN